MSLKYEPSSEPLHISAKKLFWNWEPYRNQQSWRTSSRACTTMRASSCSSWIPSSLELSENTPLEQPGSAYTPSDPCPSLLVNLDGQSLLDSKSFLLATTPPEQCTVHAGGLEGRHLQKEFIQKLLITRPAWYSLWNLFKNYWLQDRHDHRRRPPAGVVVPPGSRFLSHNTRS